MSSGSFLLQVLRKADGRDTPAPCRAGAGLAHPDRTPPPKIGATPGGNIMRNQGSETVVTGHSTPALGVLGRGTSSCRQPVPRPFRNSGCLGAHWLPTKARDPKEHETTPGSHPYPHAIWAGRPYAPNRLQHRPAKTQGWGACRGIPGTWWDGAQPWSLPLRCARPQREARQAQAVPSCWG